MGQKDIAIFSLYIIKNLSTDITKNTCNETTESFFQVFIDWLDLEERWDSYQVDKTFACQVMFVIYIAIEMAILYFT